MLAVKSNMLLNIIINIFCGTLRCRNSFPPAITKAHIWLLTVFLLTPVVSSAGDTPTHIRGNLEEALVLQVVERQHPNQDHRKQVDEYYLTPVVSSANDTPTHIRGNLEEALMLQAAERLDLNQHLREVVEGHYVQKNHTSFQEKVCPLRSVNSMPRWDC